MRSRAAPATSESGEGTTIESALPSASALPFYNLMIYFNSPRGGLEADLTFDRTMVER
jgi:hypothetical protein